MHRRLLLAGVAAMLAAPAFARAPRGLWFDPTQLPSYSGRLERWLLSPDGVVTRALFREGTQVIFPAEEAEALMAAVKQDETLVAYGVRARSAPVVIMLAWARSDSEPANFIASPSWFASETPGREAMELRGKVRAPLLSPQGEAMGVILEEGGVIRLPLGVYDRLDWLKPGAEVAAAGPGARRDAMAALDAARIGPAPERMEAVTRP